MNNFFKVLKINSVLSVLAPMVFKLFFLLPCCGENRSRRFGLASMKHLLFLLILKILTETPFKMVVAALRKPPVILKSNTFKNYLNFPTSSAAYGTFL
jgi:hypothetical protein